MSRIFEALKAASRSPVPPREDIALKPAVFSAFGGLSALEATPAEPETAKSGDPLEPPSPPHFSGAVEFAPFFDAHERLDGKPADTKPETNNHWSSAADAAFFPVPPVTNGQFGSTAKVAFGRDVRVLPQATDYRVVEQYRRLRTKILQEQVVKPFRTLMIASPNPKEGKTVTTLNLGFSFVMLRNFKVVVVDGDLRKSSLGRWLGIQDHAGLSNLIEGSAQLQDVVFKSEDSPLHFVVSGNAQTAPAELLQSPRLSSHLRQLAEHFDLVLVDSPPVNLLTDAQLLAGSCDAVLLLARAFSTSRKSLERAVEELQRFRLIGTVLNGGSPSQLSSAYSSSGYSGYYGAEK